MPTLSQPELLPGPFAYNGDKNDIPDASASLGAASYQQGFPPITQLPVNAGGIPPQRNDFNGILNALSQHTFWQQSGGMYAWSATLDYAVPSMVVGSDKELYFALQPSGPGTAAGAKNPTSGAGKAYWQNIAYVLPVATATKLGGVMVNKGGLQVSASGLLSLLLMQGGGLNMNASGQLYVDTADFSEEMLRAFLEGIIAAGGGLGFDSSGKLYVDADAFSEDLLERFLKSIRVPLWLSKPLDIYVATTGSDALDEGRGLAADKPFATLQAALNYASTTYNLYRHSCTIHLAAGDYGRNGIALPAYTTTTGTIFIQGADANDLEATKIGRLTNNYGSAFIVRDLTIIPQNASSFMQGTLARRGEVDLRNVLIDISGVVVENGSLAAITAENPGRISISATAEGERNGLYVKVGKVATSSIISANSGVVQFSADIHVSGDCTLTNAFASCTNSGLIFSPTSLAANPGRHPVVTSSGTITGKRYAVSANGIVNTQGGGQEFFPGTVAGTILSGGQYV